MTLVRLPPCNPEPNPVEHVWLYPRERHLSHRLLAGCDASVDALCHAWNQLTLDRSNTLTSHPHISQDRI